VPHIDFPSPVKNRIPNRRAGKTIYVAQLVARARNEKNRIPTDSSCSRLQWPTRARLLPTDHPPELLTGLVVGVQEDVALLDAS
jgi:hypothetical protein